jgi:hypothetical protein
MNTTVQKMALMAPLLLLACLLAGAYGIVHDQFTFTISPEYFTKFKFIQFQTPPAIDERLAVAIVGWGGTWWMGAILGIITLLWAFGIPTLRAYTTTVLKAYAIVALITILIELSSLLVSIFLIDRSHLPFFSYLYGADDMVSFARVGIMHTCGYAGGFLGLAIAAVYVNKIKNANKRVEGS